MAAKHNHTLAGALGAAMLMSAAAPMASAETNPFSLQPLHTGYNLANYDAHREGGCGEGKCGGDKASKEGKCGEGKCGGDKASKEGKCGEGSDKAAKEGKCGEGKCGGDKASKEGKCGEGKCGS